ncbi:MAG: methionyl-tRNA formyltransferase [Chloroflexi bacterium]|nr:methionyl-tRNA formyltransferase [Chloroflexota bacterium]
MNFQIVFMGSPEFALPTLRALAKEYKVTGVVTQPDRPAGRGRDLTPPPVKKLAEELGLPTIQPQRLRDPDAMDQLREWNPDLIVVAAFGQILRQDVLSLPRFVCVNVHASLLPRWRGAAPIQAAILHGDEQTGVTIMCMDAGVDTGPMLAQAPTKILETDTAGTLSARLAELGAQLLIQTLPKYLSGELTPTAQDDSQATYAPMLKKEDGLLDFNRPAQELALRVRAFNPWPGTFTYWENQVLKIHRAHAVQSTSPKPGAALIHDGMPAFGTLEGLLVLDEVQPAGKRPMPGEVFLRGARHWGQGA